MSLERATLLLEQNRFDLAEKELRLVLAEDPDQPVAHAFLALCLLDRKQEKEALHEARLGIDIGPDIDYCHYVLAVVYANLGQKKAADAAIRGAMRIDPGNGTYHAFHAALALQSRDWEKALERAERGLVVEPDNVECTNVRAQALTKLGRRDEASATIDAALREDPNNADSHANMGWTLLHGRKPEEAMTHFREALRLEPNHEWARQGIVEALKARHFIYRWMLQYFLWVSRIPASAQWILILGGFVGARVAISTAKSSPDIAPFIWPFVGVYLVFAFMTWISDALFNLILRLNRFGRLALSPDEIRGSTWFGLCLLTAGALGVAAWTLDRRPCGVAAVVFGLLSLPVAATFGATPGSTRRRVLTWYTLCLTGLATISTVTLITIDKDSGWQGVTVVSLVAFFLGWIVFTWVANILATVDR